MGADKGVEGKANLLVEVRHPEETNLERRMTTGRRANTIKPASTLLDRALRIAVKLFNNISLNHESDQDLNHAGTAMTRGLACDALHRQRMQKLFPRTPAHVPLQLGRCRCPVEGVILLKKIIVRLRACLNQCLLLLLAVNCQQWRTATLVEQRTLMKTVKVGVRPSAGRRRHPL